MTSPTAQQETQQPYDKTFGYGPIFAWLEEKLANAGDQRDRDNMQT